MDLSKSLCSFSLVFFTVASVLDCQTFGGPRHGKVVVCYTDKLMVGSTDTRTTPTSFTIGDINPSLCTHLIYVTDIIRDNKRDIISFGNWQKTNLERIVALKNSYPDLKVTASINVFLQGGLKFSQMAGNANQRANFVQSVLTFLDTCKLDGFDITWQYPGRTAIGKLKDKANFVTLVKVRKKCPDKNNLLDMYPTKNINDKKEAKLSMAHWGSKSVEIQT